MTGQPLAAPSRSGRLPLRRGDGWRDGALAAARRAWDDGNYRWCAEVGKHLVHADATDAEAAAVLADALEQLGFGADNGTWRNAFLAASRSPGRSPTYVTELRNGVLHHRSSQDTPLGTTHFTLAKRALVGLVTGQLDLPGALRDGSVQVDGDPGVLARLVELLAPVDPDFAIVTP